MRALSQRRGQLLESQTRCFCPDSLEEQPARSWVELGASFGAFQMGMGLEMRSQLCAGRAVRWSYTTALTLSPRSGTAHPWLEQQAAAAA